MKNPKLIHRLLTKMAESTLDGTCGLDDEEIENVVSTLKETDCGLEEAEIVSAISHIDTIPRDKMLDIASVIVDRKLYIEQICQRYGITRATLNRWQQKGKLPPFRHEASRKSYILLSEADRSVKDYVAKYEK